jgi:hypothetical protein
MSRRRSRSASGATCKARTWRPGAKSGGARGAAARRRGPQARGDGCVVCGCAPPREACENTHCSPASHPLCRECAARHVLSAPAGTGRCPAPGCGAPLSVFSVVHRATGRALRAADLSSPLAGSVFVCAGLVGLGSLHFSRERCFVRFDRARFPWLRRDFDASPPSRDEFEIERWAFDERAREFRGSLCAAFTAGSQWDACAVLVLFDEGY